MNSSNNKNTSITSANLPPLTHKSIEVTVIPAVRWQHISTGVFEQSREKTTCLKVYGYTEWACTERRLSLGWDWVATNKTTLNGEELEVKLVDEPFTNIVITNAQQIPLPDAFRNLHLARAIEPLARPKIISIIEHFNTHQT